MRFLLYLAVIGVVVYLMIALIQRGRRSGGASPRPGTRPTPGPRPGRPVAPDDDPAFLAELDRLRREAERPERGGGAKPAQDAADSAGADRRQAEPGPDAGNDPTDLSDDDPDEAGQR